MSTWIAVLSNLVTLICISSAAISDNQSGINYLVRFGYLSGKWFNRTQSKTLAIARSAGDGRNGLDPVRSAVLQFQRMAGLKLTGEMDNYTMEAMNWPRCGVTDSHSRNRTELRARSAGQAAEFPSANYVLFGTKWTTTNLTYTITKYTDDIDRESIDSAINDTLSKWAAVTRLQFQRVTKSPLMEIKWATTDHGDGESFDGAGGILAHSFFPPRRLTLGYGLPGDVHFDDDDAWNVQPVPGKISLAHVSLHETGHAIGLDHTTDRGAVMYPFFTQSAMSRAAKLTQDDIEGIQALYGVPLTPPETVTEAIMPPQAPPRFQPPTFESGSVEAIAAIQTTPSTTTPVRTAPPVFCPFIPGLGIDAITQAADQSDSTYAIIGSSIYRINDEGGAYPGYPKPISSIFPNAPSAPISGLVTYIHSGTSFDRRYMYLFKGDNYWRYEIRKSAASLEEADLKLLQGPSLLQMLVQQFLLGQQQTVAMKTAQLQQQQLQQQRTNSRNMEDGNFRLQFVLNGGYPKKIAAGFKGINAPGAVIFQLVSDELIYFVTSTQYWTFSPLQSGNSTPSALSEHPVLRSLPVRPPLLQAAMYYNGRNYFFASNGSYWVWSPSRQSPESGNSLNVSPTQAPYNRPTTSKNNISPTNLNLNTMTDYGRWSMALSIPEWWFNCNRQR